MKLPAFVVAPLFLALSGCASVPMSDFPPGTLTIANLSIGDSQDRVLAVLGAPTSAPRPFEEPSAYDLEAEWSDGEAYFSDGRLAFLQTARPGHCTGRGLCVGDSASLVQSKIGCTTAFDPEEGGYSCFDTASACSIEALVHGQVVSALRLECLP